MGLFSQRKGFKPVKSVMQIDFVDNDLRNGLWNALSLSYWSHINDTIHIRRTGNMYNMCQVWWHSYFKLPLDTMGTFWYEVHEVLKRHFFECKWYEVYDFIEFTASNYPGEQINQGFMKACNTILERELSAYRFVGSQITEITSEEEIAEVEKALEASSSLKPVVGHLDSALALLADKKSPDYRNSIKESISAVEAISSLITGSSTASLGQALKELEKKRTVDMHPALRESLSKLYGYTSDADGIRHALLEESSLDFEDAKFMLVSCSAFVNYLKAKSSKAGINL